MTTDEVHREVFDQHNLILHFQTSHFGKMTIFLQGKTSETSKI